MRIREDGIDELADIIRRLNYDPISFDDPDLFPETDDYIYPNYVFFMVAIDHRTGFGRLHDKYQGSDLLFYLARRKQKQDRYFFTAERLAEVDEEEIRRIFTYKGVTVSKVEERAFLLRDCAEKLLRLYDGDVMNLFKRSGYILRGEGGILGRLRVFRAYEDPMMKKSFLLIKILKRQGLKIKDPQNLGFPVDNVLVKVALSCGIVEVDGSIAAKIGRGGMLTEGETEMLRGITAEALKMLSEKCGMEADVLDDVLWSCGRTCSLSASPDEEAMRELMSALRKPLRIVFPDTWYF